MSKLKIHSQPGNGIRSNLATVSLDGQELKSCTSADLHISVDEPFRAKVEVLALDGLDVEIDASVELHIVVYPGVYPGDLELEETPLPNGGRRLRAVPILRQREQERV